MIIILKEKQKPHCVQIRRKLETRSGLCANTSDVRRKIKYFPSRSQQLVFLKHKPLTCSFIFIFIHQAGGNINNYNNRKLNYPRCTKYDKNSVLERQKIVSPITLCSLRITEYAVLCSVLASLWLLSNCYETQKVTAFLFWTQTAVISSALQIFLSVQPPL